MSDPLYDDKLKHLFFLGQERETAPVWALTIKLQEEVGEFSEAVLQWYDFLQHKPQRGTPMEEAADTIIVVLAAVAKTYPDMTPDELMETLADAIESKTKKYEKVLEGNRVAHSASLNFDEGNKYGEG